MMVPAVGKQGKGRSLGWKGVPRVAIGGAALTVGNEGDGRQRHRQSLRGALEQYLQRSHLQAAATIERRRNAQIWREERSIRIVIPVGVGEFQQRPERSWSDQHRLSNRKIWPNPMLSSATIVSGASLRSSEASKRNPMSGWSTARMEGLERSEATQGFPFRFTDSLEIDAKTGVIYFTDSSKLFQRWDRTGRLMRFDPNSKEVAVLLYGLYFPNEVALSEDSSFLLVSETTTCRILRYQLQAPRAAANPEVVAELPGFPDNMRSPRGGFWVALHSQKG
ncbi:hypothetical protein BHM03_00046831 [Ensete ventricosum]|nr:hypothetical protein BHM03_00046831 [Ensete ventricosum]